MAYRAEFDTVTRTMPDPASPSPSDGAPPIVVLRRFLDHLLHGYLALRDGQRRGAMAPEAIATRCTSLTLAAAVLRDLEAGEAHRGQPRQVAVVGPTQVGKSTVVNVLLGRRVAEMASRIAVHRRPEGGTTAALGGLLLRRLLGRPAPRPADEAGAHEGEIGGGAGVDLAALWDAGSQGRLEGMLDGVEVEARRLGVANPPM